MTDRDIGREVLDGIREIKTFKAEGSPELRPRALEELSSSNEIRVRLKLSRGFRGIDGRERADRTELVARPAYPSGAGQVAAAGSRAVSRGVHRVAPRAVARQVGSAVGCSPRKSRQHPRNRPIASPTGPGVSMCRW